MADLDGERDGSEDTSVPNHMWSVQVLGGHNASDDGLVSEAETTQSSDRVPKKKKRTTPTRKGGDVQRPQRQARRMRMEEGEHEEAPHSQAEGDESRVADKQGEAAEKGKGVVLKKADDPAVRERAEALLGEKAPHPRVGQTASEEASGEKATDDTHMPRPLMGIRMRKI